MAAIVPTPGVVYKFVFDSGYDCYNGTYRLVKLMTYDEYLNDDGDILVDFYTPNGKDETAVTADLEKLQASKIMKLVSPDDADTETVVLAPLCFLTATPDCNVREYQRFGIISLIGITDNVEHLDFMRDALVQLTEASLGISPDPKFMTVGNVWLTDTEYAEEVAKRDDKLKKVVNYFPENRRLERSMSSLKTLLADYEALIVRQQQQLDAKQKINAELQAELDALKSETGGN